MKRHFKVTASKSAVKAAADITKGWWTKYYNSVPAEASFLDAGYNTTEIDIELKYFQKVADNYGYKFRGFLDAKDEYVDALDSLSSVSWFTDEMNNIVLGEVVRDRIYPVTKEDVEAQLEAFDEAQLYDEE